MIAILATNVDVHVTRCACCLAILAFRPNDVKWHDCNTPHYTSATFKCPQCADTVIVELTYHSSERGCTPADSEHNYLGKRLER